MGVSAEIILNFNVLLHMILKFGLAVPSCTIIKVGRGMMRDKSRRFVLKLPERKHS